MSRVFYHSLIHRLCNVAKNNKTSSFYVLYSVGFLTNQSECRALSIFESCNDQLRWLGSSVARELSEEQ